MKLYGVTAISFIKKLLLSWIITVDKLSYMWKSNFLWLTVFLAAAHQFPLSEGKILCWTLLEDTVWMNKSQKQGKDKHPFKDSFFLNYSFMLQLSLSYWLIVSTVNLHIGVGSQSTFCMKTEHFFSLGHIFSVIKLPTLGNLALVFLFYGVEGLSQDTLNNTDKKRFGRRWDIPTFSWWYKVSFTTLFVVLKQSKANFAEMGARTLYVLSQNFMSKIPPLLNCVVKLCIVK